MRKLLYFILIATLCSCSFSKGVKKDLATGLFYNYNGFRLDKITAYNGYGEQLTSNVLPEFSNLVLIFNNVENYEVVEGVVSFGCELTVTDEDGKVCLEYDDLFKNMKGIAPREAKNPRIIVTFANPMVAGKTYLVKGKFYDKHKPENHINVEMKVEVTPAKIEFEKQEKVLSFEKLLFGTPSGEFPENKVKLGTKATILVKGIKGYTLENDRAFVGCSVVVTDKQGNRVLESEDIFADNVEGSTSVQAEAVSIDITYGNPIKANQQYHVHARIFDKKNPDAEIVLDMNVDVVE